MRRFPRFILVVACMHTKKYKKASDIFMEYLEGFPHIKNKCYGEYCNTTFYIIPNTVGLHRLLDKLPVSIIRNVLAYRIYERMLGNSGIVYLKYSFALLKLFFII